MIAGVEADMTAPDAYERFRRAQDTGLRAHDKLASLIADCPEPRRKETQT